MDVVKRRITGYNIQSSIRKINVIKPPGRLHLLYVLMGVFIRNDNGSHFMAIIVRQYSCAPQAHQEFTPIGTSKENSEIEASNNIADREVLQRYDIENYYVPRHTKTAYFEFYHNKRLQAAWKEKRQCRYGMNTTSLLLFGWHRLVQESEDQSSVSAPADTRLVLG